MTRLVTTIYEKGVFLPTEPVALDEGTIAVLHVDDALEHSELWRNPAAAAKVLLEVGASARPLSETDDASLNHDK